MGQKSHRFLLRLPKESESSDIERASAMFERPDVTKSTVARMLAKAALAPKGLFY
jgi:hypothetical protein